MGDETGGDHGQHGKGPPEKRAQETPLPEGTDWDVPIPEETEGPGVKQEKEGERTAPQFPDTNRGMGDTAAEVQELVRNGTIILDEQGNKMIDYREESEGEPAQQDTTPQTKQEIEDEYWGDMFADDEEDAEEFAKRSGEVKLNEQIQKLTTQSVGQQKAISKKDLEVQSLKKQVEQQGAIAR